MESEKITGRWYDDACGTAHALELIGERWALLVMRELMFGPRRFRDLRAGLPGISANVLTQRLEGLEAAGLVRRRILPPPAGVQVYELTGWGYEAEPLVKALGAWAARSPAHDPGLPLSAASLMLSFRTMFAPERAGGFEASIGFRLNDDAFIARVAERRLAVERAEPERVDALVTGAPEAIAGIAYGGAPIGQIAIEGDSAAAATFLTLFALPPKAGTSA